MTRDADLAAAARAAAEALTLDDLAPTALPLLGRGLNARHVHIIRFDDNGAPRAIAGNLTEADPEIYFARYFADDPITAVNRRVRAPILVPAWHLERRRFERSPVYNEFYRPRELDQLLCACLARPTRELRSLIGTVIFRSRSQPEFAPRDLKALARALPAFEAAARRARRVEALLTRARVAVDGAGRLSWMSPAAETLLGGRAVLPAGVLAAARRLAAFAGGRDAGDAGFAVSVPDAGGWLDAELHVERTPTGEPVVVAELERRGVPARVAALASRHGLTPAETEVLAALGRGLSNAAIARSRAVSLQTVKTHVHRILAKLGVRSRLQAAALLAR